LAPDLTKELAPKSSLIKWSQDWNPGLYDQVVKEVEGGGKGW